jgi:broad specificity phosphatase PhoE
MKKGSVKLLWGWLQRTNKAQWSCCEDDYREQTSLNEAVVRMITENEQGLVKLLWGWLQRMNKAQWSCCEDDYREWTRLSEAVVRMITENEKGSMRLSWNIPVFVPSNW